MRVIAYTYEADYHCIDCTRNKFRHSIDAIKYVRTLESQAENLDENGVPINAVDSEGNKVHPVFSTDELPCDLSEESGGTSCVACGDCFVTIRERSES